MNQNPEPWKLLVPLLVVVVTSVTCMNSALLLAELTLNSSIDSTDGNMSREAPPARVRCDEMPSIENDVWNGRLPATEIDPARSCCTPWASVATTIGLVLLVARKFRASRLISSPDFELSMVARSVSITGFEARTSTVSAAPASDIVRSMRTFWRASKSTCRVASAKPASVTVIR